MNVYNVRKENMRHRIQEKKNYMWKLVTSVIWIRVWLHSLHYSILVIQFDGTVLMVSTERKISQVQTFHPLPPVFKVTMKTMLW